MALCSSVSKDFVTELCLWILRVSLHASGVSWTDGVSSGSCVGVIFVGGEGECNNDGSNIIDVVCVTAAVDLDCKGDFWTILFCDSHLCVLPLL